MYQYFIPYLKKNVSYYLFILEPGPPALGVWSLTHWTTREVPVIYILHHNC